MPPRARNLAEAPGLARAGTANIASSRVSRSIATDLSPRAIACSAASTSPCRWNWRATRRRRIVSVPTERRSRVARPPTDPPAPAVRIGGCKHGPSSYSPSTQRVASSDGAGPAASAPKAGAFETPATTAAANRMRASQNPIRPQSPAPSYRIAGIVGHLVLGPDQGYNKQRHKDEDRRPPIRRYRCAGRHEDRPNRHAEPPKVRLGQHRELDDGGDSNGQADANQEVRRGGVSPIALQCE